MRGRVLAVGLLLAVLGLGWVSAAAPLLAWHADRAERLEQRTTLARRMEAVAATLPRLRQDAAPQAEGRPAPRALLAGASDAVAGAALQDQVGALATQAGMALSSAELLAVEAAGPYRRVGLRVAVSGPFPGMVGLWQALDQASPRMLVDDVQAQVSPVVGAAVQPVSATFTVIAFRAGP